MPRKGGDWDSKIGKIEGDFTLDTAITPHAAVRAQQRGIRFDDIPKSSAAVRIGARGRIVATVLPTVQRPQSIPGSLFLASGSGPQGLRDGEKPPTFAVAGSTRSGKAAKKASVAEKVAPLQLATPAASRPSRRPDAEIRLCWAQAAVIGQGGARIKRWRDVHCVNVGVQDSQDGGHAVLYDTNQPPQPQKVQAVLLEIRSLAFRGLPDDFVPPSRPAAVLDLGDCGPGDIIGEHACNLKAWEREHGARVVVGREAHSDAFTRHYSGKVLLYDFRHGMGMGTDTGAGAAAAGSSDAAAGGRPMSDPLMPANVAAVYGIIEAKIRAHGGTATAPVPVEKPTAKGASSVVAANATRAAIGAAAAGGAAPRDPSRSKLSEGSLPDRMLPPQEDSGEEQEQD